MRTDFKQGGKLLTITSPFGTDDLLVDTLEGVEGLSEPFSFTLKMRSGSTSLDAATIIGKTVTVTIAGDGGPTRYINGIATRFVQTGGDREFADYEAEVRPKLWLLTLSRDRKIYQNKSVKDILEAVLGDFGVTFQSKLTGTYTALDYCVQYDETAFEFVSRLMERAGIFYFFTFTSSTHTMVLADASSAHVDCTGAASIRFFPETGDRTELDMVSRFAHETRLVLKQATVSDRDYLTPSTSLEGTNTASDGSGETYDFPAGHTTAATATSLAKLRVEAARATGQVLRGNGYAYPFTAGTKFTLQDHFVSSLNTSYILVRVRHEARGNLYTNAFEAIAATVTYRPPLLAPAPRAYGAETALVTGPSGEEIWTDKYGRIKIQFYWDRDGKKDDNSSLWVRVAQSMAGKGFGTLFVPRVGQEVVVSYIDGNPERPLVTGCVYNGENTTPVTLPANQTQSTILTRSSKTGTAGNELRFEDKKDSEQVYLHAQKDLLAEIENALTTTVKKGAEIHTLEEGDRTIELKKGKETHTVKGTRTLDITGDETHGNSGAFTHTVEGDYSLTISGKLTINVTGGITIKSSDSVLLESGTTFTSKAGTALTNQSGTTLDNKAGTDLTNNAGVNLVNQGTAQLDNKAPIINSKADASQTVDGGALLTLKGALAKIN